MKGTTKWKIVAGIVGIIIFCVLLRYALLFSGGA